MNETTDKDINPVHNMT